MVILQLLLLSIILIREANPISDPPQFSNSIDSISGEIPKLPVLCFVSPEFSANYDAVDDIDEYIAQDCINKAEEFLKEAYKFL